MKVIDKLKDRSNEKWHVGDVIKFKSRLNDGAVGYGMVVRVNVGQYAVATLLGAFDGEVGAPRIKDKKWVTGELYATLKDLQYAFLNAYESVRKVPFYGVVGELEED